MSQAADILAFGADLVPIGEDQNPMIEQTNEIARRFNAIYNVSCFKDVKPLVGKIGRLPGVDGKTKMSKSLGNAIMLGDTTDDIRKKVNAMFTDPNHLRIEDPGTVDGHVVFLILSFFDPNQAELNELKAKYTRGGLGDGVLKKRLVEILDHLIAPMRERRLKYGADLTFVRQILKDGTSEARQVAALKMDEMKRAMMLVY